MSDDLIERLRAGAAGWGAYDVCAEAAERLTAILSERDALQEEIEEAREFWRALETEANEMLDAALDREARLREALLWIDTFDPETTAAAEERFGFSLIGSESVAPVELVPAERLRAVEAERDALRADLTSYMEAANECVNEAERLREALRMVHGKLPVITDLTRRSLTDGSSVNVAFSLAEIDRLRAPLLKETPDA